MALHSKRSKENILFEGLSKTQIPQNKSDASSVYAQIKDELMLDGNSKQNLATFCQTQLDDFVGELMNDCIDKNMIDKDEYPQTAEIESRCVNILANLWNAQSASATGCSTTGSSEAAMLGGLAMKWRWREALFLYSKHFGLKGF